MYKRVVAGVAALLMFSSALPMPEIAQLIPLPTGVITAEAASINTSASFGSSSRAQYVHPEGGSATFTLTVTAADIASYLTKVGQSNTDSTVRITNELALAILDDAAAAIKTANKNITSIDYNTPNVIFAGTFTTGTFPNLSHVYFEDSYIDTIQGCFYNMTNLQTVDLGDHITAIGANTFSNCSGAFVGSAPTNTLKLNNVTTIGSKAFENNYCMQKITFPSKTTSIDITMFNFNIKDEDIEKYGYTPVESITVNKNNVNYSSENGVLFNKDKSNLLYYPYRKKGNYYTVPDSVTVISASAFASNRYLQGIILDAALKTISDKAFYNTASLEFIDFVNNTTVAFPVNKYDVITSAVSGRKITLYGEAPSTASTYAENSSAASKVVFVASAATLNILDKNGAAVDSIRLSNDPATYQLGSKQMDGNGNETTEKLVWASENEDIATVDENGLVTILSTGKVNITLQNEKGSLNDSIELSIFEKPVITLEGKSFVYTGSAITPAVTVKSGDVILSEGVDYTVSYASNVNAGTARVTITGKGNYPFSVLETFTITAKPLAGGKITPQYSAYTYTGKAIKPVYTVKDADGNVLTENTDYTATITKNDSVGVAEIKVIGKGKYAGTLTGSFVVKPAKNAATLSDYNGGIKVTFNKGTAGTVGYQIVYCQNKNFPTDDPTYHSTTVDASKNQLYANLTSVPKTGETWYVRVRSFVTADGKTSSTRYGAYSDVKTVKIK